MYAVFDPGGQKLNYINNQVYGDILIVEDSIINLKYLTDLLTKEGYSTRTATNGKLAQEAAQVKLPDLILMDINLPDIDGIEVCRRLKGDLEIEDFPIIFISASFEIELKVKALQAGGIDYVTKPFNDTEVLIRIKNHLNMARLQNNLKIKQEELKNVISKSEQIQFFLKESEEKYKALYEGAPLPYQSLDEDGCFLDVNPAWLQTLGYDQEEVTGKRYADFLHPDWKPHFEKNFPKFKKEGYIHNVQFKIRHKDGHYLDISFEGCIGYTPEGYFRQTYCVFKDITEQKKIEKEIHKSEVLFKGIFDQAPFGIELYNSEGHLFNINKKCLNIFGINSLEEVKKFPLFDDPNISDEAKSKLKKGYAIDYEAYFDFDLVKKLKLYKTSKSGKCWLHVHITPYEDSLIKYKGYVVHVQDLSEKRKAIEELEKHRLNLEEMVKNRTAELERKNKALEEFNDLFINREFRIKELRERVKELETGGK
jgi:PAS domain S-box-containing protein